MATSDRSEEKEQAADLDEAAAELFEAISHPTRVRILRALSAKAMGFADLKNLLGIKSPGNLSHHLHKLGGLVETDSRGLYALTDRGREALLPFARAPSPKVARSSYSPLLLGLLVVAGVAFLITGLVLAFGAAVPVAVVSYRPDPASFQVIMLREPISSSWSVNVPARVFSVTLFEPILGPNQSIIATILTGAGAGLTILALPLTYLRARIKRLQRKIEELQRAATQGSAESI